MALLGQAHAADDGFYVTAGLGISVNDLKQSDADMLAQEIVDVGYTSANVKLQKSTVAGKIGAGYKVNRYLALEAAYMNLGTFEHEITTTGPTDKVTVEDEYTGTALSLVGMLPISDNWSLLGRIGHLKWKNEIEARGCAISCATVSGSAKGSDTIYGLGGNWEITDRWGLTAEWNGTKLNYDGGGNQKLNLYLVSGRYKF